ncbi:MAG TPA: methyl-accepting chemotaxis protein [Usitatibacter sp.]|nr:methyl-accepting chemotaxis protein [Usitatibacter sp.]
MRLGNLSVRARLAILLAFVNLLLLAACGYAWYGITGLGNQLEETIAAQNGAEAAGDLARRAQVDFKIQVQEWKDVLLRGTDPALYEKYLKNFTDRSAMVTQDLKSLAPMLDKLGLQRSMADTALAEHAELDRKYLEALKMFNGSSIQSGHDVDKAVRGIDRAPTDHIDEIVKKVQQRGDAIAEASVDQAGRKRRELVVSLAVLALFTVGVSIAWGTLTVLSVSRRLRKATEVARIVASGNLSTHIEVGRDDELGQLLASLRDMNASLADIVDRVRESAEKVTVASTQIAAGNNDLSSRTEEQASNLEETAASIEEMTATVDQNAQNASTANEVAAGAARVAQRGGQAVGEVVKTMHGIQESSRRIADIIGVIDSIAFQTNILALNAAVEAARAGEQGRGFAVVAGEVRNLAQRSAEAAREIKALITESVQRVDAGAKLAGGAGSTMEEIVASVTRVSQLINQIATATTEQSAGIAQANAAVSQLDKVTQQNAALVEESTAASESLRQLAFEMSEAVSVFKLAEGKAAAAPALRSVKPAALAQAPAPRALAKGGKPLAKALAAPGDEWTEF